MSTSRITQSQITDPRCWSFARRALAEKRSETQNASRSGFGLKWKLPNQEKTVVSIAKRSAVCYAAVSA